ncbi:MAG: TaqI-like C-terminal specificity domain-containing protein [Thermodesulfovibrionales bacterium]
MNRHEAVRLIQETFNNPFDEDRFRLFSKNLLNELDESKAFAYHGQYIPDAFKDHIRQYKRIGKYTDPGETELDVLVVYLKKETSLERARTMQRNFVAHYLKNRGEKDAAIVAFCTDGLEDWRFSFVRMDYRTIQTESGKVKVKEDLTPARRYSFLVGSNEPNHTAQQQLVPILEDDRNNPTLADIEHAFNIESITKEFFNRYKDLFLKVKDELDNVVAVDQKIKTEFESKYIETANFAKKLLGQIVFLYFIQKKGWLGVVKDKTWGTGPRNFLRKLFEKEIVSYEYFFNDILEPLFYEALAIDREESFYNRFNCKIPFLNGGLFEPINGYNWEETDILLANETFREILDTFDLYNFTVREDEPLEREVAVDPEMLGKVFENLLEVRDRKSKGAYYTPREIVHYMCQRTLISYLDSTLNENKDTISPEQLNLTEEKTQPLVSRADIEAFIRYGEFTVENDKRVVDEGRETKTYPFQLSDTIRNNAVLIDDALSSVKICDPAIGSGAFPVGIMHEIIKARETLTTYLGQDKHRTRYDFKRHAIQESIYGVDIDPSAVEIAKLRLWLSLVVDEDDYHSIKPLPNLDYKIMQGNSLFEEYEGNKLFDEKLIISTYSENEEDIKAVKEKLATLQQEYIQGSQKSRLTRVEKQKLKAEIGNQTALMDNLLARRTPDPQKIELFEYESDAFKISNKLRTLHANIFEVSERAKKDTLRQQIEELEWQLIEVTLKEQHDKSALSNIEKYRKSSNKPFFIWKLHFSEVFQEKGGFDVVIANPPYVRHEAIKSFKKQLEKEFSGFYCGTADLYTYFFKKGLSLLRPGGHLCFIAPNKFMRAGYGKNTRKLLATQVTPKVIIDFCDLPIFDATTYPSIILVEKTPFVGARSPRPQTGTGQKQGGDTPPLQTEFLAATFTDAAQLERLEETLSNIGFPMPVSALREEGWNLERPKVLALMEKLRKTGKPLGEYVQGRFYRGILTGLNEAFVIDEATRKRLVSEDSKSEELIKPWLRGRDIKKWKAEWAELYVINISSSANRHWLWSNEKTEGKAKKIFAQTYPAIHKHLSQWKDKLVKRDDQGKFWWELRSCAYNADFERPKIIYPDIAKAPEFTWDESNAFLGNTAYIIPTDEIWLLGLLNSQLTWWLYLHISSTIQGGFVRFIAQYMEQLPIALVSESQKISITKRVQTVLTNPDSSDVPRLEAEINKLVYVLYGLTPEEIEIVEGKR